MPCPRRSARRPPDAVLIRLCCAVARPWSRRPPARTEEVRTGGSLFQGERVEGGQIVYVRRGPVLVPRADHGEGRGTARGPRPGGDEIRRPRRCRTPLPEQRRRCGRRRPRVPVAKETRQAVSRRHYPSASLLSALVNRSGSRSRRHRGGDRRVARTRVDRPATPARLPARTDRRHRCRPALRQRPEHGRGAPCRPRAW